MHVVSGRDAAALRLRLSLQLSEDVRLRVHLLSMDSEIGFAALAFSRPPHASFPDDILKLKRELAIGDERSVIFYKPRAEGHFRLTGTFSQADVAVYFRQTGFSFSSPEEDLLRCRCGTESFGPEPVGGKTEPIILEPPLLIFEPRLVHRGASVERIERPRQQKFVSGWAGLLRQESLDCRRDRFSHE